MMLCLIAENQARGFLESSRVEITLSNFANNSAFSLEDVRNLQVNGVQRWNWRFPFVSKTIIDAPEITRANHSRCQSVMIFALIIILSIFNDPSAVISS